MDTQSSECGEQAIGSLAPRCSKSQPRSGIAACSERTGHSLTDRREPLRQRATGTGFWLSDITVDESAMALVAILVCSWRALLGDVGWRSGSDMHALGRSDGVRLA